MTALRAPFPYNGGKSRVAPLVWDALGNVNNYVEPFFGSGAVLLARPHEPRIETVNDLDGMIANFWRAVATDPESVARFADWPINETDLHARHRWLIEQRESLAARLETDPYAFDPRVAGWWVWGLSCWIGSGWCQTARRQLPFIGNSGMGVHSKSHESFSAIAGRLRRVRVVCGDWHRVVSHTSLFTASNNRGMTGVFLDPPYAEGAQQYAAGGTGTGLSADVREWALGCGSDPRLRIVLAGYTGEHDALTDAGWRKVRWDATSSGYVAKDGERKNQKRECLWFSPHCLDATRQPSLFGGDP